MDKLVDIIGAASTVYALFYWMLWLILVPQVIQGMFKFSPIPQLFALGASAISLGWFIYG